MQEELTIDILRQWNEKTADYFLPDGKSFYRSGA